MKIVFVLTQSLESPSGLGRFGPLARQLAKRGHNVEVLALHPAWNTLKNKIFVDRGVRVHYVSQMHVRKEGNVKRYFGPGKLLWVSLLAVWRLARALWRSDAEVIQLCKPQPFNSLAVRLARRGRPVMCDCDDYEAETNKFNGRWQRKVVQYFEDNVVKLAAALTVNTRFTQHRYIELGFPADKIIYVPNGVERERFVPPPTAAQVAQVRSQLAGIEPDNPLVVYVGTLGLLSHPVDLLLEAFAQVREAIPKARLLLVGSGEDFEALKAQSEALGIAAETLFVGRVSPEKVPIYLQMAAVTVDPIHDDLIAKARSPLKVVESLAVGTPVVTADVGDRRDMMVDATCGRLVAAGNAAALASGIIEVLQNSHEREQMKQHSQQWYWDRLIDDFMRLYEVGLSSGDSHLSR